MHQVKGANPFALTIFLSLWCSSANMPASHAGDHRSKAGQGRQFSSPQSILSDALLWYGSQFGAIPGGGSILVWRSAANHAVEPALRHVSYARSAHGSTGGCDHFRLHASSLRISFVMKSCRGSHRLKAHPSRFFTKNRAGPPTVFIRAEPQA